jgi:LysM repeat protein
MVDRRAAARAGAPLLFLAAVTIAVLLVRSGLDEAASRSPSPLAQSTPAAAHTTKKPAAQFYRIRAGDTLAAVAPRFGLTEAALIDLNPGIEPTALHVGERIRVR